MQESHTESKREQQEEKERRIEVERVPAPVELEEKPKNKKRIWYILGGVFIAVFSFIAGFGARWFSLEEDMRTLINVKNKIDKEYYQDISDEEFYDAVFGAINLGVLDQYSGYMRADSYATENATNAGRRSGIGLVFLTTAADGGEQMLVYRVAGNSPAEEAGFLVGDYIIGFGAQENAMIESVQFDKFSQFLNEQEDDKKFFVRIKRGEEVKVLSVCRSNYVESYVFYRTNKQAYTFTGASATELTERGQPLSCLDNQTAYIRLIQFTGKAYTLMAKAMELFKSQGMKNLVLDLRGNGGGNLDVMQGIVGYFCKNAQNKKPLVLVADYGERKDKFYATRNVYSDYFSEDSRICVLADEGTASASEALMGAMLDYGTIGYDDICLTSVNGVAKTYGKGIMQTTYVMDILKQDALKLTTATIHWPLSNKCIHDKGIVAADGVKTVEQNFNGEGELVEAIGALFS